jgi:hypothetical protein
MNQLFTGILTVFMVAGIIGAYIPNALATITGPPESPLEICSGNIAAGQQGNSAAEQEKEQGQTSDTDGQAVTPELNALNANNLNLGLQQNGECIPTVEQPPSDFTTSSQN